MRIDKLVQGMEFKNYKALCEFMEVKVKTGEAKIIQLAELSRSVEWHKVGNKIIIDEVLAVKLEKVDKRKDSKKISNNSKYSSDIQALLIDLLASKEANEVYLPANRLLKLLELVNCNYAEAKKQIPKLSEITNIPVEHCFDFFSRNNVQLKNKLETALKGLRNRALVMWEKTTSICILVPEVEFNELDELKINQKVKYRREHREATREEKQFILKTERQVLAEIGCATLQYAFLSGKWNEFLTSVNKKLLEQGNIEYYYDSYKIIYNYDDVNKEYLKLLTYQERKKVKNNLNSNINKMVNNYAKTLNNRAKNKIEKNTIELLQSQDIFLEYTEKLANIVIDKNAKNITKELKKPLLKKTNSDDMPF